MSASRKLMQIGAAGAEDFSADILVVGGGGAGGSGSNDNLGGGGGAGRLVYVTGVTLTTQITYDITVGAGGASSAYKGGDSLCEDNTQNFDMTATGGGAGGGTSPNTAVADMTGGCGGGGDLQVSGTGGSGSAGASGKTGFTGTVVYNKGFGGGSSDAPTFPYSNSGGGGGTSNGGGNYTASGGGAGGSGQAVSITGSSVSYGGGGGGGAYTGSGGSGGSGGGGTGGDTSNLATAGTDGLGAGGGGGGHGTSAREAGGAGGDGTVIIRSLKTASSTTGSPTLTTDGSYKIYTFTSDGTITF